MKYLMSSGTGFFLRGILIPNLTGKGALRMRTVMNERVAATVNTAAYIRTGFVSDHPKSRPE